MSIVTFESVTASGTDDMGKFQFAVDSTGVIEVNDAGITGLLSSNEALLDALTIQRGTF